MTDSKLPTPGTGTFPKDPMLDPYNQAAELRKQVASQKEEISTLSKLVSRLLLRIADLKGQLTNETNEDT